MNIERLRRIVQYSNQYGKAVEWKVRDFYARIGMNSGREVLNTMQIVSSYLQQQGFLVIELPYKDAELGALTYKGDGIQHKGSRVFIFSTPRLVQVLRREGILTDRDSVKKILSAGTEGNLSLIAARMYDLKWKEMTMSVDELTDLIMEPNGISILF